MTELLNADGIVRWLGGSLAVHERAVRRLLSRDDAPRPIVITGRRLFKRDEVQAWLENLPSVFGNEMVTGTKYGPMDEDH